eukprot:212783-Chlamydomonas_euryale.AAC.4
MINPKAGVRGAAADQAGYGSVPTPLHMYAPTCERLKEASRSVTAVQRDARRAVSSRLAVHSLPCSPAYSLTRLVAAV